MTLSELVAHPAPQTCEALRGRKPSSFAMVRDLPTWMRFQLPVFEFVVIRTSDRDKAGFAVMFKAGIAMNASNPDVQVLGRIGPKIVTDEGAPDRERLGAYELRRGSVPGGRGYALLGYTFVIGRTLFILYLESARCADIAGETKDQTKNAFTEALCIMLRFFRPAVCYTPLVSRVFRNMDFAAQLLRTMRALNTRLVAEGVEIPLGKGDDELMALLKAFFAAKEADGIVSRLGNIEVGIYLDGSWYLGEGTLPFTWRVKSRSEINALTGETIRVIEDKHTLEPLPEAAPVLQEFLAMAGQQSQTRHQLGMRLGERGVVSRAPRHAGKNVRLNSRPENALAANGATTLLQECWLTAWEHGYYRRMIKLKSDPRAAMPELADRVIDVDDEMFLEVETLTPAPPGGWGVDAATFARVRKRLLLDATSRAAEGRKSKSGQQKPLNHLCDYTDDLTGYNFALTSLESGESYELRSRPKADARDKNDLRLGWRKTDRWLCTVQSRLLHASVANAILGAIRDLEGQTAPLVLRAAAIAEAPVDPLEADLVAAREAKTAADARLMGIKERLQTIAGLKRQRALTRDEEEQLEELPGDEAAARAARREAVKCVAELEAKVDVRVSRPMVAPEREVQMDADFAMIDVVAAGLARTTYRAPDSLHELLCRVLRNFQVRPVTYDTAVTWTATLVVPLIAGGEAEFALSSDRPIPSSKRDPRRPDSDDHAALSTEVLSWLFMRDGIELTAIGSERGICNSGAPDTTLFRLTILMLEEVLGVSRGLACAATDMPAMLRPTLYRVLQATDPLEEAWDRRLAAVYRGADAFGAVWCMGHHREVRKVIQWLETHADDPFVGLPSHEVAEGSGVPHARLLELAVAKTARVRKGSTYGRGPLLGKDFGAGKRGNIFLLQCPHQDCTERIRSGRGGVLLPIATPETTSSLGRPNEPLLGSVCRSCRRLPGLRHEIVPEEYFEQWVGGRRQQVTDETGTRLVGSRLAPLPKPLV